MIKIAAMKNNMGSGPSVLDADGRRKIDLQRAFVNFIKRFAQINL